MKIAKYYIAPFIISAILIIYGIIDNSEKALEAGVSLVFFLLPAVIGSILGIRKKKEFEYKYLYIFSLGLTLFVSIHVLTDNFYFSSIVLFLLGLYFLFLILISKKK
jgi:hypothetical protein